ncbi:leukocidin family pore-forming toxin, partial [Bacillus wiedmannii]|uniref:leukocidin family pore-forming toxin n=1 Tax=Bacillus wiedmannii TaxID=1890302 RepID=UPI000BED3B68
NNQTTQTKLNLSAGTDIGDNAKMFKDTSISHSDQVFMKTAINVSFIEDPNSQKKVAVLTTDGSHIDSYGWNGGGSQRPFPVGNGYWRANMYWPSAYETSVKLLDTGDEDPKFSTVAPTNGVTDNTITNTVGYTAGGQISQGPNATAGTNWSTSVSYHQPDYKTEVVQNTDTTVAWRVPFVSMMNQGWGPYSRESNTEHTIAGYKGNELFIKSGTANVSAKDNFISADEMTPLVGHGFSPAMIATLAVDSTTQNKTTQIQVTNTRCVDDYEMHWADLRISYAPHWFGINYQDKYKQTYTTTYELDWENHTISQIDSNSDTKDLGYGKRNSVPDSYPQEH